VPQQTAAAGGKSLKLNYRICSCSLGGAQEQGHVQLSLALCLKHITRRCTCKRCSCRQRLQLQVIAAGHQLQVIVARNCRSLLQLQLALAPHAHLHAAIGVRHRSLPLRHTVLELTNVPDEAAPIKTEMRYDIKRKGGAI